jgi:RNA polymerase sigma-70 factor, ECF subfamily
MISTSMSLLRQAQQREPGGWERFQSVYEPLIRFWVHRDPAARHEADDLVQDLLLKLHLELPHFQRQRLGSFRKWLRVLATNRVREFLRKRKPELGEQSLFDQLAKPSNDLLSEWDTEYDRYVVSKLLRLVRQEYHPDLWKLFELTEIQGQTPRDVAESQQVSIGQVYRARHNILTRLRELGQEILEKDE